ncbi:MAG: tetratricopeptide repeat protein [Pseudomonadota bacterium]
MKTVMSLLGLLMVLSVTGLSAASAQTANAQMDAIVANADAAYDNKDYRTAMYYYDIACEANHGRACMRAGDLLSSYAFNDTENVFKPDFLYYVYACLNKQEAACSRGAQHVSNLNTNCRTVDHPAKDDACFMLGMGYLAGGFGLSKDTDLAVKMFERLCDRDYAVGCFQIGLFFGKGVDGSPDGLRAEQGLKKACDLNFAIACTSLGVLYNDGLVNGKGTREAFSAWDLGCKKGDPNICLDMGNHLAKSPQVERYGARAVFYYETGCRALHQPSCHALAYALLNGKLVPQNKSLEKDLFVSLCDAGHDSVCNDMHLVEDD